MMLCVDHSHTNVDVRCSQTYGRPHYMRMANDLFLSMSYEADDVWSSPGKSSIKLSAANSYLTLTTVLSYSRQPPTAFSLLIPSTIRCLANRLSPTSTTPIPNFFSIFFSGLTQAHTVPEDPYMALPPAKSRRRSEPPTSINIDMDQTRRARLSSGVAGGWDLTEEEYGIKPGEERRGDRMTGREEDERRSPRMGRQRSRSAGEVSWERPGFEHIYPPAGGGRGLHAGEDAEKG
jgi:hypothetical protein